MSRDMEPPGCSPTTHWEARAQAMEFALQDLIILIGTHSHPSARLPFLEWCERWTQNRDQLREKYRVDKIASG